MAHPAVVGTLQRAPDHQPHRRHLARIEPAPLRDPVGERPLAQLGDEVGPPVGEHVRGVHGDDPGVLELRLHARLAAEALARPRVGG